MKTTDRTKLPFRVGVLSVVKHDYLPRAIAAHPPFEFKHRRGADENSYLLAENFARAINGT